MQGPEFRLEDLLLNKSLCPAVLCRKEMPLASMTSLFSWREGVEGFQAVWISLQDPSKRRFRSPSKVSHLSIAVLPSQLHARLQLAGGRTLALNHALSSMPAYCIARILLVKGWLPWKKQFLIALGRRIASRQGNATKRWKRLFWQKTAFFRARACRRKLIQSKTFHSQIQLYP